MAETAGALAISSSSGASILRGWRVRPFSLRLPAAAAAAGAVVPTAVADSAAAGCTRPTAAGAVADSAAAECTRCQAGLAG